MRGRMWPVMACAVSVEECGSANHDLPLQARASTDRVERQIVDRRSRVVKRNGAGVLDELLANYTIRVVEVV